MVGKYRKRPVTIEAVRVPALEEFNSLGAAVFVETVVNIASWCGGRSHMVDPPAGFQPGIYISTLEGQMRADPGDWIIKGVQGEFYPCKPNIFADTYEEVVDA